MATKFDGVIEAARYAPEGTLVMVRAYVRRGAAFSDHVLINRETLVERLKNGKKYFTGQRTNLMAGTFELSKPVRLVGSNRREVISTSEQAERDQLEETPIF